MSRSLLILGATGKQGGAVIQALLQANAEFEILAVTRDPQSSSAQNLQRKSPKIKLVTGNLDQPREIFQRAKEASEAPIWGVFSVQTAVGAAKGIEERQGKAIIDASIENKVKKFVYSSVDRGGETSSSNPTDVPHFISKHNIEQYLFQQAKGNSLQWTVLRPVAFFENLVPGFPGKAFTTCWQTSLKDDKPLQLVATSDIGYFAAQAFLKPEEYNGKCISLAGDEMKYSEFKRTFEQQTGETLPSTYGFLGSIMLGLSKEFGNMFRFFRNEGYGADIPALKQQHPGLLDFRTWLAKESAWKKR